MTDEKDSGIYNDSHGTYTFLKEENFDEYSKTNNLELAFEIISPDIVSYKILENISDKNLIWRNI